MAGTSQSKPGSGSGRRWIGVGFVVLFVMHHDFWWWDDRTLVLGFLPVGLAYHAVFSLAAGVLWALASRFAWPAHLEAWAERPGRRTASPGSGTSLEEGRS